MHLETVSNWVRYSAMLALAKVAILTAVMCMPYKRFLIESLNIA